MIHRIGRPAQSGATLMTRVLQRYDAPEDEDIQDVHLFRESRESRVLRKLLKEYCQIYPHSQDGLSIAVFNATQIQPVIAGLDDFLHWRFTDQRKTDAGAYPPFHLSLAFFVSLSESREVSRWLREWQSRWDPASGAKQYEYYRHCRLDLSQKVVAETDGYDALIQSGGFDADIAVLFNFMDMSGEGSDLEKAPPAHRVHAERASKNFPASKE
jgi:DNA phosphorothioation-dependent restriction protein DptH